MKYEKSRVLLKNEYLKKFNQIELYANVSNVMDISDEILCELMEMFLTAQKNEMNVETVIGNDMNKFCVSLFSSITKQDKIKAYYKRLYKFLLVVFVLELFPFIMNICSENNVGEMKSNIHKYFIPLMICVPLFWITNYYFKTHMFKWKKTNGGWYHFICILEFVFLTILIFNIPENWSWDVPTIFILSFTGIYIVMYLVFHHSELFKKGIF